MWEPLPHRPQWQEVWGIIKIIFNFTAAVVGGRILHFITFKGADKMGWKGFRKKKKSWVKAHSWPQLASAPPTPPPHLSVWGWKSRPSCAQVYIIHKTAFMTGRRGMNTSWSTVGFEENKQCFALSINTALLQTRHLHAVLMCCFSRLLKKK